MKAVEFGNLRQTETEVLREGTELAKGVPLEQLLMAKNKALQSQLVQSRTQLSDVQGLLAYFHFNSRFLKLAHFFT